MTWERNRRGGEAGAPESSAGPAAPGKRTRTQSLPPGGGPSAAGGALFGPVDPPDARPVDPHADPFGLHLLRDTGGEAPAPGATSAAARAGLGDVSGVRLHNDPAAHAAADAHDARAFAVGPDVFFGASEYAPGTPDGDRLLGHELAHAAQQRDANVTTAAAKLRTSSPGDASELEADTAGETFAAALAGHRIEPVTLTATPATVAREGKRAPRAVPEMNAAIKVTAYTAAGDAIEWTSRARWDGALPLLYTGTRAGDRWTWDNTGAKTVYVNTSENGSGGDAVEKWATAQNAERVVINVVDLEDVTALDALDLLDYRDPKKRGTLAKHRSDALGHALPEEHAGDGSTAEVKPDAKPDAARRRDPKRRTDGDDDGQKDDRARTSDAPETDGPHAEPGDGTGTGTEHRDGIEKDERVTEGIEEGEDEEAEADVDDAALDEEIEILLQQLGHGGGGGDGDEAGGALDGRTGDDTSPDGIGQGGDRARSGGGQYDHKYGTNPDGVDVKHDDAAGGEKDRTATDGRVGGENGGEAGGVRGGGGFAMFGFTVAIPEALSGAVEVALIIESGNIVGFGPKAVQKAAQEATENLIEAGGAAAVRRALKREAAAQAAKSMRTIRKEIAQAAKTPTKQLTKRQRQILKEWGHLTREETKRAMRITSWELQRRYFQETVKAARAEARALRKGIKRTKDVSKRADLRNRLAHVDQLREAAEAAPIAGRLPIGHRYAGQDFPRDKLPKKYRDKGLHVDAEGFPEFERHALTLPNGKKSVQIEYTGSRRRDFAAANKAAGLDETPENFTWHHHQELGKMELIPTELHDAVKHSGGVATHKHARGVEDYAN